MERSNDDNTIQNGDMKDIRNCRPISLLSHMYKTVHTDNTKRMEKVLDKNQPRQQAGFRKVTKSSVIFKQVIYSILF